MPLNPNPHSPKSQNHGKGAVFHILNIRFLKLRLMLILASLFAVGSLLGVNGLAFMHGRAMTTLVPQAGPRTQSPEALGPLARIRILLTGVQLPRPTATPPPTDLGFQFEVLTFASDSGHQLEAWYAQATQGDSTSLFILFHPYGGSKTNMVAIARELLTMGHSVMLVDFYGSGGSSGTTTSIGYFEALDVVAAVTYARDQWQPKTIGLYGASMGGAAVLRAVAVHTVEVEAIAIESAFDSLLHTVQNRFDAMGLPVILFPELLVFWGGQQQSFNGFSHNPAAYAQQVTIPTLLIHGKDDQRVSFAQSQAIYTNLQGWKQFSLYPGSGHGSSLSHNPEQWRTDIQNLGQQLK
ncbi:MAG: alpha/beta fold hydrolase [Symploca sp. SIO2B6]|nr:alpha/beta fold hydrolase [Symploca sp. SIO2B6]